MSTFKVENVSQQFARLCSKKFRVIAKWHLIFRYDDRFFLWISSVILNISKKLTWFSLVTYLDLQTGKVWAKSIFQLWPRFLWFLVAIILTCKHFDLNLTAIPQVILIRNRINQFRRIYSCLHAICVWKVLLTWNSYKISGSFTLYACISTSLKDLPFLKKQNKTR